MSTTQAETEVIRRVHTDGHCIEVGEWPDAPDHLELRTSGEKNVEYFGRLNLAMTPDFAMQLGRALVAAATEKGAK